MQTEREIIPLNATKKIILRNFVWSIQKTTYLCTHKQNRMSMLNLTHYFPITDPTLIFFVVLLIVLFAPIIMGKLRIPHIIGMVLAGIVVGKYGLNILERDSSFELFGKVGLYYIMFLAALEMDMEGMKKTSRAYSSMACLPASFRLR